MRDSLQALLVAMPRIGAVGEADDGAAAIDKAAARRPALLVLDTNLPGAAAWGVLREFKSRWPETQCVILAQSASQRETAQAAGADGVLVKGFPTAELYVMIDELLACQAGDVGQGAKAGRGSAPGDVATPAADSAGPLDGGTG
jgi:DNA-binding NarL/FixJ family response regulator